MYRAVEEHQIRLRLAINRSTTCQVHHHGLVFRRLLCGLRRVPVAEAEIHNNRVAQSPTDAPIDLVVGAGYATTSESILIATHPKICAIESAHNGGLGAANMPWLTTGLLRVNPKLLLPRRGVVHRCTYGGASLAWRSLVIKLNQSWSNRSANGRLETLCRMRQNNVRRIS
jgi:hypothetical protein